MRLMASSQPSGVVRSQEMRERLPFVVLGVAGAALCDDERVGDGNALLGLFAGGRRTSTSTAALGREGHGCQGGDQEQTRQHHDWNIVLFAMDQKISEL